jgi:hypothetical protein
MNMTELHRTNGIPTLTNQNDEEFGEGIVELFIAHANATRHSKGLSDLCIGALASVDLSHTIRIQALLPSL